MADNNSFDALRQKRLRYVESARENDFEEGLKSLLSELYPDNAHFIYELLQNADDAMEGHATQRDSVAFLITDDALWMANSGRALTDADVQGLCGLGASSKVDAAGSKRASITVGSPSIKVLGRFPRRICQGMMPSSHQQSRQPAE